MCGDIEANARGVAAFPDQILIGIGYAVIAPDIVLVFAGEQENLLQRQAIEPCFKRTDITIEGTDPRFGVGAKVGKTLNAQAYKGAVVASGKVETVGFAQRVAIEIRRVRAHGDRVGGLRFFKPAQFSRVVIVPIVTVDIGGG